MCLGFQNELRKEMTMGKNKTGVAVPELKECYDAWQFLVPGVAAGLIETSVSLTPAEAQQHVRRLIRIRLRRQRLPRSTSVLPYNSPGAVRLRKRALAEKLPVQDRLRPRYPVPQP